MDRMGWVRTPGGYALHWAWLGQEGLICGPTMADCLDVLCVRLMGLRGAIRAAA